MPGMVKVSEEVLLKLVNEIEPHCDTTLRRAEKMSQLGRVMKEENKYLGDMVDGATVLMTGLYGPEAASEFFDNMVIMYFAVRNQLLKEQAESN